jgi:hypothetical protein
LSPCALRTVTRGQIGATPRVREYAADFWHRTGKKSRNQDTTGTQIVVPGFPPAPNAYDGQFVQMDVAAVIPAP